MVLLEGKTMCCTFENGNIRFLSTENLGRCKARFRTGEEIDIQVPMRFVWPLIFCSEGGVEELVAACGNVPPEMKGRHPPITRDKAMFAALRGVGKQDLFETWWKNLPQTLKSQETSCIRS